MKNKLKLTIAALAISAAGGTQAGSIIMTGHDVLLHGDQFGAGSTVGASFTEVALEYLRGAGTGSEIAKGSYEVGLIRDPGGSASTSVLDDYGTSFSTFDISTVSGNAAGATAFSAFLAGKDAVVIASHASCGGCALSTTGSNTLNFFAPEIASWFNAGGDIFANAGADLSTYYDFLPPAVATTGPAISGSNGFSATADGLAIGLVDSMLNGRQTHNRFTAFDPDFKIFEIRGTDEFVTIGLRDATIGDDGIGTDDGGDGGDGGTTVPEPSLLALLSLGLLGMIGLRRRGA